MPWNGGSLFKAGLAASLMALLAGGTARAIEPKGPGGYLEEKEFLLPELTISSANVPLDQVLAGLPNRGAWESFLQAREQAGEGAVHVFVDPRSGAATNLVGAFPLLPAPAGGGAAAVADAVRDFARRHRDLLGVDPGQLGAARAGQVNADLWQVSIPQVYRGVPVRGARLAASVSHGNLAVVGAETWGHVRGLSTVPKVSAAEALAAGFAHAGGGSAMDELLRPPALEIVPVAPPEHERGNGFGGPLGAGYRHRLVWTFVFRRPPEVPAFEVIVDAHSGQVIAFQDVNRYANQAITGGVYPVTATEVCPTPQTCGTMQSGWPMPFADTGLAAPNDFTNSAGVFDWTSGTVTTTLTGKYVAVGDECGAISNSAAGALNLGGANGQHNCTSAGGSPGNTSASRTAFYEVNKLAEMGRGWLPANAWLQGQLPTYVNIGALCNALYNPPDGSINFFTPLGGCRNSGEIAGVLDHEWGHALDDNDTGGVLSNTSEAYADIAAIYRLQASCIGHGFWWTSDKGCGQTSDGTGFNSNEAQTGSAHCDLDCSGVRDADYLRHSPNTPDTALGFVCASCTSGPGPCGREVHCAAAPSRQAAWDLVARDLQQAPFNLDSQTAFIVGNKLFYQGSGNIGDWHACTCNGSSSGCAATNAYMQWITADDDNGNLNDGTPHMTAIHAAFNRHGIACATPAPQNGGCGGGPTGAATLAGSAGSYQAALSWSAVAGATRYWVFRSEGHAGCDFGKALIAETTGLSYTDTQVGAGRTYSYNVVAAGASSACYGPVSNCVQVTPPAGPPVPDFTLACNPSSLSIVQGGSGGSTCTVTSQDGFAGAVSLACTGQPAGVACGFVPNPVTPPANGSVNSTLTVTVAGSTPTGLYSFSAQGTSGALFHTQSMSLTVTSSCLPLGASCTTNSQCCSNRCKGNPKTCR